MVVLYVIVGYRRFFRGKGGVKGEGRRGEGEGVRGKEKRRRLGLMVYHGECDTWISI